MFGRGDDRSVWRSAGTEAQSGRGREGRGVGWASQPGMRRRVPREVICYIFSVVRSLLFCFGGQRARQQGQAPAEIISFLFAGLEDTSVPQGV